MKGLGDGSWMNLEPLPTVDGDPNRRKWGMSESAFFEVAGDCFSILCSSR